MERRSLKEQPQSGSGYTDRTPDYYLKIIQAIQPGFSTEQLAAIQSVLEQAVPKPAPKLVDLRFGVDLIVSRFYVVLFVGKDRRQRRRPYLPEPMTRLGNLVAAVLLLIGLNLLISIFIVLLAYLIKSALGIDFFPSEHLADQINKLG